VATSSGTGWRPACSARRRARGSLRDQGAGRAARGTELADAGGAPSTPRWSSPSALVILKSSWLRMASEAAVSSPRPPVNILHRKKDADLPKETRGRALHRPKPTPLLPPMCAPPTHPHTTHTHTRQTCLVSCPVPPTPARSRSQMRRSAPACSPGHQFCLGLGCMQAHGVDFGAWCRRAATLGGGLAAAASQRWASPCPPGGCAAPR
jgi:hypothetical protein